MEHASLTISILVTLVVVVCQCAVIEPKPLESKVFHYQGALPIKDDRTGEVIHDEDGTPPGRNNQTEDGEACWNLIVEQSTVTFALQTRVLDQLETEMKGVPVADGLRQAIEKANSAMRKSMNDALAALRDHSPEDYFDSLFEVSEGIVAMSSMIRDPELDKRVFLVLVKAVTRLGRNNSALIQEFIDQCSFAERSRPRALASF